MTNKEHAIFLIFIILLGLAFLAGIELIMEYPDMMNTYFPVAQWNRALAS